MPSFLRLVFLGALACGGGKADADADADTDTDTDTDTDADTDGDTVPTGDTAPVPEPEVCDDGVDNDLDLNVDCADPDCDTACDADGDGVVGVAFGGLDCDDASAAVQPRADEVCDGVDNDCDLLVDTDDPSLALEGALLRYADGDLDGFGGAESILCAETAGYLEASGDCDDGSAAVNPAAVEVCNGVDDNCADGADDADPNVDPASQTTWWTDADDDSFGDPALPVLACADNSAIADNPDDCDDADRRVRPGGIETCGDGIDQDCDGADLSC